METISVEQKALISLDRIIEYILDNLEEKTPPLIKNCERSITTELNIYTQKIMEQIEEHTPGSFSSSLNVSITEQYAGELLDSICEANNAYLETGVRIGANLLWQLLGL